MSVGVGACSLVVVGDGGMKAFEAGINAMSHVVVNMVLQHFFSVETALCYDVRLRWKEESRVANGNYAKG